LGDTSEDGGRRGGVAVYDNRLGAVRKVGSDEVEGRSRDAVEGRKAIEENVMVNGVEGGRKVEQDERRNLSMFYGEEEVILDSEQGGFS
jgi:hypothetical protein